MLSTLRTLPALARQLYRSGQALIAVRRIQAGATSGRSVDSAAALDQLARAMRVRPTQALDIYLGRMNTRAAPADIVSAHKTLLGASYLARLSPSAGPTVKAMLSEVKQTHIRAVEEGVERSRKLVAARQNSALRVGRYRRFGLVNKVRAAQVARAQEVKALGKLTDELEVLSRGLEGGIA